MYSDTEYYFDTALIYIIFNVCYYNITLAIQTIPGCTSNTENENVPGIACSSVANEYNYHTHVMKSAQQLCIFYCVACIYHQYITDQRQYH